MIDLSICKSRKNKDVYWNLLTYVHTYIHTSIHI